MMSSGRTTKPVQATLVKTQSYNDFRKQSAVSAGDTFAHSDADLARRSSDVMRNDPKYKQLWSRVQQRDYMANKLGKDWMWHNQQLWDLKKGDLLERNMPARSGAPASTGQTTSAGDYFARRQEEGILGAYTGPNKGFSALPGAQQQATPVGRPAAAPVRNPAGVQYIDQMNQVVNRAQGEQYVRDLEAEKARRQQSDQNQPAYNFYNNMYRGFAGGSQAQADAAGVQQLENSMRQVNAAIKQVEQKTGQPITPEQLSALGQAFDKDYGDGSFGRALTYAKFLQSQQPAQQTPQPAPTQPAPTDQTTTQPAGNQVTGQTGSQTTEQPAGGQTEGQQVTAGNTTGAEQSDPGVAPADTPWYSTMYQLMQQNPGMSAGIAAIVAAALIYGSGSGKRRDFATDALLALLGAGAVGWGVNKWLSPEQTAQTDTEAPENAGQPT